MHIAFLLIASLLVVVLGRQHDNKLEQQLLEKAEKVAEAMDFGEREMDELMDLEERYLDDENADNAPDEKRSDDADKRWYKRPTTTPHSMLADLNSIPGFRRRLLRTH